MTTLAAPRYAAALAGLDQAGVRWCLLRGDLEGPGDRQDVDLLVAKADLARAGPALAAAGFLRVPPWGVGPHHAFLAYDEAGACWRKFDVVTELAYGPGLAYDTGAAAGCLERGRRAGSLVLLDEDDEFWTLLLHCLLDRDRTPPGHAGRLARLAPGARSDGVFAALLAERVGRAWDGPEVVRLAQAGEWAVLRAMARGWRASWSRRRPLPVACRLARNAGLHGAARLRASIHRRRFAAVVVVPAGVDRPALAAELERALAVMGSVYKRVGAPHPIPAGGPRRLAARLRLRLGGGVVIVDPTGVRGLGPAVRAADGPEAGTGPEVTAALWRLYRSRLTTGFAPARTIG